MLVADCGSMQSQPRRCNMQPFSDSVSKWAAKVRSDQPTLNSEESYSLTVLPPGPDHWDVSMLKLFFFVSASISKTLKLEDIDVPRERHCYCSQKTLTLFGGDAGRCIDVIAKKELRAGEELLLHYGDKSLTDFLQSYAFIPEACSHEVHSCNAMKDFFRWPR